LEPFDGGDDDELPEEATGPAPLGAGLAPAGGPWRRAGGAPLSWDVEQLRERLGRLHHEVRHVQRRLDSLFEMLGGAALVGAESADDDDDAAGSVPPPRAGACAEELRPGK
jgi:hypothetical protein